MRPLDRERARWFLLLGVFLGLAAAKTVFAVPWVGAVILLTLFGVFLYVTRRLEREKASEKEHATKAATKATDA